MSYLQQKLASYLRRVEGATLAARLANGVARRLEGTAQQVPVANWERLKELKISELDPLDVVHLAYAVLLRRPIDPQSLAGWDARVQTGDFDLDELIYQLVHSPEFKQVNRLPFIRMVHRARLAWVETLGAFENVLDIGGSSPTNEQGSLIDMGYKHRPRTLTIFDLPPERQFWGRPSYSQTQSRSFDWGVVNFVHGHAEKIAEAEALQTSRYDLVFMGQAIEHLWPAELPAVLSWIREHLTPGGSFVLDTPNRILTAIQNPASFINADHKIEYTPDQLSEVLEANGFEVTERHGLVHMPTSFKTGSFAASEVYDTAAVSERADECYLFALHCRSRTTSPVSKK